MRKPNEEGPKLFYVYTHKDPSGIIFYVGKGKGDRAWSKERPIYWQQKAYNGYSIDIFAEGLTEEEALIRENALIVAIGCEVDGRGPLVNKISNGMIIPHKANYRKAELYQPTEIVARVWEKRKEDSGKRAAMVLVCSNVSMALEIYVEVLKTSLNRSIFSRRVGLVCNVAPELLKELKSAGIHDPKYRAAYRQSKKTGKKLLQESKSKIVVTTVRAFNPQSYEGSEIVETYDKASVLKFLSSET